MHRIITSAHSPRFTDHDELCPGSSMPCTDSTFVQDHRRQLTTGKASHAGADLCCSTPDVRVAGADGSCWHFPPHACHWSAREPYHLACCRLHHGDCDTIRPPRRRQELAAERAGTCCRPRGGCTGSYSSWWRWWDLLLCPACMS